jgi:hypothetical protein
MKRFLMTLALAGVSAVAQADPASGARTINPVVEWNRTLLSIVRTPGAQPATIHPTRSFAMLHAAVYDAVNVIDGTHAAYLVSLSGSTK